MSKGLYVWELPVRITHWVNAISIFVLTITGLYIGDPYWQAKTEYDLIMALMRFFHFLCAYFLIAGLLFRIYWWFVGNKYAKLDQFIPVSVERWSNLIGTALFYGFMKKDLPHSPGHTGLAGLTYFFLFILLFVEIITGFALYSQSHAPNNTALYIAGGWLLNTFDAMTIRFVHHILMWCFMLFVVIHVYISVHNQIIEKNGLVWSIFTGYKKMDEHPHH
ncbi:MAG: Ni/Fe-hydrogenase, b-type cytochrome subunit [Thermodesulfovibrionales bacterium]